MNRLFVVIVLVVAGVAGLGFYLEWFRLGSDTADKKVNITLTVDKDKIEQDENKVEEKVQNLIHKTKDKAAAPAEKSKDRAAPPVQPREDRE